MNDLQSDEELAFVVEDAKEQIIVPAIEKVLKGVDFDQVMQSSGRTHLRELHAGLVDLQKPLKYVAKLMRAHVVAPGFYGPSGIFARPICYGCSGERRHAPGRVALRRFHLLPLNWMQSAVTLVVFCLFLNAQLTDSILFQSCFLIPHPFPAASTACTMPNTTTNCAQ